MIIVLTAPDTYSAVIGGVEWHGITSASRFWVEVQQMILDGAEVVEPTDPGPTIPAEVTKLQIRDQAVSMAGDFPGLWEGMKAFINADPDRAERWALAIGIPTDDPIIDQIQTELEWTQAQRDAFLIAAGAR